MSYQSVTGTLSQGAHPGSYNGQDAYNDMLVTDNGIFNSEDRDLQAVRAEPHVEREGLQGRDRPDTWGGEDMNQTSIVRRLTPTECERLQGFPDGWTDIGEWTDSKGKKRQTSDTNRYKALGNSIALPYWKVLARRIAAQYDRDITMGSLFDGIGGFPLAFEHCGAKAVWASEIEDFCIAVTRHYFKEGEEE